MDKQEIEKKLKEAKSLRTISNELNTSYTNLRHWIKKLEIQLTVDPCNCLTCNTPLSTKRNRGERKKFCSIKCKNSYTKHDPSKSLSKRLRRKCYMIKELGGKCSECGYSKNLSSLDLHHTDPNSKSHGLDSGKISRMSIEDAKKEMSKCIILCRNCHNEHHYPAYSNWQEIDITVW